MRERTASRLRLIARELGVFAFFFIAAVVVTWPLARNISTAVSDVGDPFVSISIFDWEFWATFHRPAALFHQPIFHPARYALAFTEHLYGIALVMFPLYLLGFSSIAIYNVSLLLGFALCGYGAYVLSRTVTGSLAASIAGGLFFAFLPYRITQIPHISYVWSGWLPLALASLLVYDRRPSWKQAAIFGAVLFANGITCLHWFAMGSLAIALSAIFLWLIRRPDSTYGIRLAAAMVTATLALLPFLLPYQEAGRLYGMTRRVDEAEHFSANLLDWLTGSPHLPYAVLINDGSVDPERWLFPGFVPLLLVIAALVLWPRPENRPDISAPRSIWPGLLRALDIGIVIAGLWSVIEIAARREIQIPVGLGFVSIGKSALAPTVLVVLLAVRLGLRFPVAWGGAEGRSLLGMLRRSRFSPGVWVALLWVLIGVIGSLGLNAFFHSFLFEYVRPFRSIRVAARWAMIAYVGLSVLVSCGVVALQRVIPSVSEESGRRLPAPRSLASLGMTRKKWVPILAALLLFLELKPAPSRWYLTAADPLPVYRWLAEVPLPGAILELPVATFHSEYEYLFRAREHRRPLVNGVSSFIPPQFDRLVEMAHANPVDERLLPRLEEIGCAFIVVHADRLAQQDGSTRQWLQRGIQSGRLSFLRRFLHHQRGDYLFAINRVVPNAAFWREAERPDRSGATPSQHLRRFLESNAFTYFDAPLVWIDQPVFGSQTRALTVSGWVGSPDPIERVNLLFGNAAVTVPAELFSRPELTRELTGYPESMTTGFRKHFPARPGWARDEADLIVEVLDRSGRRTRLEPLLFRWRERDDIQWYDWNPEALSALLRRADYQVPEPTAVSVRQIVRILLKQGRGDSDRHFIQRCYRVLLNRPADPRGLELHLAALRSGKSRRDVAKSFIRSEEFRRLNLKPD